jgi:hypothetical protein
MARRGDDRLAARLHSFEETCSLVAGSRHGRSRSLAMSSSGRLPWISIIASSASIRPKLLLGQLDVGGAEVLLDALNLARAGDGHNERLLVQHPGQRDLGGVAPLSSANACSRSSSGWFLTMLSLSNRVTTRRTSSLCRCRSQ